MYHFDQSRNVVKWASEEFFIPYVSPLDGRRHRYFPDFLIELQNGKRIVIEVKPLRECERPVLLAESQHNVRRRKRYLRELLKWEINQAKWKAARAWCAEKSLEFHVLTERELGF